MHIKILEKGCLHWEKNPIGITYPEVRPPRKVFQKNSKGWFIYHSSYNTFFYENEKLKLHISFKGTAWWIKRKGVIK